MITRRQNRHRPSDQGSLAEKWTSMWNGELALVDEILAADFAIEFGAVITEADPGHITSHTVMARFVAEWRQRFGDLRFELQGPRPWTIRSLPRSRSPGQ